MLDCIKFLFYFKNYIFIQILYILNIQKVIGSSNKKKFQHYQLKEYYKNVWNLYIYFGCDNGFLVLLFLKNVVVIALIINI